jgi:hypothetical protein
MLISPLRDDRTPARAHPRTAGGRTSLSERIDASVASAVGEALAKVSTPADSELAARQAAFDRMLKERAELEREANAISQLTVQQAKRDDELMQAWIKLI